jgi:peroxiredoxin (alkyl hydroperoxide reductase subunit C)
MEEKGLPLIGDPAPAFTAQTTHGEVNFPDDYQGKWVVLFSHPADFTPVCTTEFMTFASMADQFKALNCELIGLSIDSNYSHIAWARTIEQKIEFKDMKNVHIGFPIIADLTMDVAHKYGMLHPGSSSTHAVRATFIIDDEAMVRAILYYPQSNGRNMDEILRLVKALQTADEHGVATPANWQPGDEVIIPPPPTDTIAAERMEGAGEGYRCLDWFLCLKKL